MSEIGELRASVADLADRLGKAEDETSIRGLHHVYGYYLDYCRVDDVVDLFAEDGEAVFLSGVYRGHASLRRLYRDFLQATYTNRREGPIYGFIADHLMLQDVITVANDRGSAKARSRALLALGSHDSRPDKPLQLPDQV